MTFFFSLKSQAFPLVCSSPLTVTSNVFIQGELLSEGVSPLNLKELHSFIGLQCNVGLTLPSIIRAIGGDAFGPKCILGTESDCLQQFGRYYLFEVPILSLAHDGGSNLTLTAVDGKLSPFTPNRFDSNSVHWYVVPNSSSISDSASITPTGCSKSGSTTTCTATFSAGSGAAEDYTIFASGHGDLGPAARQFKEITITPPSAATEIRVTNGGKWGTWRDTFMCPDFQYVTGISLKVEGRQEGDDDTALNNIRLHCSDGSTVESNEAHSWGTWGTREECPSGRYMTGFKLKVEADQGSGDDTAANSMAGVCSDGQTITPTNGGGWGQWGSEASCPSNKKVCGAQLKIEPHIDGDDTAVNDVILYCCD
ncbi:MAG: hypothetical protein D3907_02725 [Candidatus Electrothrix sp. AUS3]|nr:hypothetical protein [Candidatus Electrothrix gigas]